MPGVSIQAMIQALRSRFAPDPAADLARAQAGAEALSQVLPSPVMPRAAIEEDRRRKAAMDQMLRDAAR